MSSIDDKDHFKIRLNSIHPSEPVPFDIYVWINQHMVHYLKSGDQITKEKLANFEQKAPDAFFILDKDRAAFKQYVHGRLNDDQLSSQEKAIILRESSFALVAEIFESEDVKKALEESSELITDFIEFMDKEPEGMAHLIGLSSHDFYTYNHSLDVGIYSLGLGHVAGFNESELHELGQGALFHDIGKRHVAVEIITKSGPLDEVEWAQMRKHPQFGLKILNDYDVSDAIKACCFEHHESAAGNGYPQELEGDEIHPMARIVALTDTYDALTTKRSYNDPMTPRDALNFMNEKLAGRYDSDLLKAMYSVLFKMEKVQAKTG